MGEDLRFYELRYDEWLNRLTVMDKTKRGECISEKSIKAQVCKYKQVCKELVLDCTLPRDCTALFSDMPLLQKVYIGWHFESYAVQNMCKMFDKCPSLISVDTYRWDTSNVKDMTAMFRGCENLEFINMSQWNTSNVVYLSEMFKGCGKVTKLGISNWDFSNVQYLEDFLRGCHRLFQAELNLERDLVFQRKKSTTDILGALSRVGTAVVMDKGLYCTEDKYL